MKSQGMQDNQQVVFLSDGAEDIRQVQEYLHPNSEHVIDWFQITMRLTVLQQQTKALEGERPATSPAVSKQLESIKHPLWHGNVAEALERLAQLRLDLELIWSPSAAADKLAEGVAEFEVYIRNNQESIPNYGERYRQGETISTAFVESTINQVVSRRFVKKQQMHWTLRGGAPASSNSDHGPEQRTGRGLSALVSVVRSPSKSGVTTGFLLLSSLVALPGCNDVEKARKQIAHLLRALRDDGEPAPEHRLRPERIYRIGQSLFHLGHNGSLQRFHIRKPEHFARFFWGAVDFPSYFHVSGSPGPFGSGKEVRKRSIPAAPSLRYAISWRRSRNWFV
jgi:hypothetical protein